jgi:hypothetical protein
MATTETKTSIPFDTAFEQATELNERFVEAARKAGNLYLDSYQKAVDRAVELELELAGLTRQEWLKTAIETQADFTREVSDAYAKTARSLLK